MISRDEAQKIADSWANSGETSAERTEVSLYEFEHGYVAAAVLPEREDSNRPPENIGGGRIVIDKQTGEVSYWPSLSARMIAEQYSAERQGTE